MKYRYMKSVMRFNSIFVQQFDFSQNRVCIKERKMINTQYGSFTGTKISPILLSLRTPEATPPFLELLGTETTPLS